MTTKIPTPEEALNYANDLAEAHARATGGTFRRVSPESVAEALGNAIAATRATQAEGEAMRRGTSEEAEESDFTIFEIVRGCITDATQKDIGAQIGIIGTLIESALLSLHSPKETWNVVNLLCIARRLVEEIQEIIKYAGPVAELQDSISSERFLLAKD
jgi:hypothetical protein